MAPRNRLTRGDLGLAPLRDSVLEPLSGLPEIAGYMQERNNVAVRESTFARQRTSTTPTVADTIQSATSTTGATGATLSHDLEAPKTIGTVPNECYAPIGSYEGRHRWDPKAVWTVEEEKAVRKRVRPCRL